MSYPPVVTTSIASRVTAGLAGFRCVVGSSGRDSAWIRVAGELDLATSAQLRDALHEAERRARRIVLDLRQLTFMDSSGVHVIVDANNRARRSGGRLVLTRGPDSVDRLFALTGTAAVVDVVELGGFEPPVQALVRLAHGTAA
jgi:anti-anti-sigma factor